LTKEPNGCSLMPLASSKLRRVATAILHAHAHTHTGVGMNTHVREHVCHERSSRCSRLLWAMTEGWGKP